MAEKAQRALGVGGAFHIDAHKIVVTRGALGDRAQEPARLFPVNPESKLSELHRNMGPQPFPVEPVEQAQIDAASFLSRCRFGHALAQVVQRGLEPLVIQPVDGPDSILQVFARDETPGHPLPNPASGEQVPGGLKFGKVEEEGAQQHQTDQGSGTRPEVQS